MVLLQLNLRRQYFAAILDGSKTVEYRDRTPHWESRIENNAYTHIRFRNGYLKVAPEMIVELTKIRRIKGEYHLHLGAIVSKKNVRLLK